MRPSEKLEAYACRLEANSYRGRPSTSHMDDIGHYLHRHIPLLYYRKRKLHYHLHSHLRSHLQNLHHSHSHNHHHQLPHQHLHIPHNSHQLHHNHLPYHNPCHRLLHNGLNILWKILPYKPLYRRQHRHHILHIRQIHCHHILHKHCLYHHRQQLMKHPTPFFFKYSKGDPPLISVPSLPSLSSFFFVSLPRNSPLALSLSAIPTESPSKRGSQRTPDPALRVRRHGVSSGEHRPFRGHFRPNHGDLASVQGINLFVSSSSTTLLFVSLNFVEYWKSYTHLNLTQFPASPTAFEAFSAKPQRVRYLVSDKVMAV
ncbi:hypothetical protein DVH24_031725 [Malus domestica]|uniref:Uncharacterized protein n=1 Tax=Malus domestica TaxID=3750 RepID=A0A498J1B2_MALDO|nr:hypothetical protein DVH24_031725 [Malus domestica]